MGVATLTCMTYSTQEHDAASWKGVGNSTFAMYSTKCVLSSMGGSHPRHKTHKVCLHPWCVASTYNFLAEVVFDLLAPTHHFYFYFWSPHATILSWKSREVSCRYFATVVSYDHVHENMGDLKKKIRLFIVHAKIIHGNLFIVYAKIIHGNLSFVCALCNIKL